MRRVKITNRNILALSSMLLLVTSVPSAMAAIITYDFEGTLGEVRTGIFADSNTGLSATGDAISGSFSFDDGLVDFIDRTDMDLFSASFPTAPNDALAGSFSASITVGSVTLSHTYSGPPGGPAFLLVADNFGADEVLFSLGGRANVVPTFSLRAVDLAADDSTGVPDGVAAGSDNLIEGANTIADAGILDILDNLDISKFDSSRLSSMFVEPSFWQQPGTGTSLPDVVEFQWTDISRVTADVPEPATLALLGLGLFGLGFSRFKRRN